MNRKSYSKSVRQSTNAITYFKFTIPKMLEETEEYKLCYSPNGQEDTEITGLFHDTLRHNRSPERILFRLDEVDEICRVCLNSGSLPIFSNEVNISKDLNHFAGIEVSSDDCLPQHLCAQCREQLDSAINFKKLAQKSDLLLKKRDEAFTSEGSQSACENYIDVKSKAVEVLSDGENSDDSVYLEYAETLHDSDNEFGSESPTNSENNNCNDALIIPEHTETDPGEVSLEALVASFNKKSNSPQCEVCNLTLTKDQLSEHNSLHDPKDIVNCDVCSNIINKQLYSIHMKIHKESYNQRIKKKYGKVECTECGKRVSKTYMKRHMTMHGTDLSVRHKICTICAKPISANYLADHIKRVHFKDTNIPQGKQDQEISKVKCPICSLMITESRYKNHISSHALKKQKFICQECGKQMSSYSSLYTHLLIHKDVYKLKCTFCPYRCKHLGLLKVHIRTHTKDYLYKCETCNASFITKSNLTVHMQKHMGVKFVCAECGKCFAAKRTLNLHQVTVHEGIKAFSCDLCGKTYGKKDVMVAHKKRVHNVYSPNKYVGRLPSYLLKANEDLKENETSP